MNITILYGTETGNAEMLAEDIASHLDGDHDVETVNMSDFDIAGFDTDTFYLLVTSTYGEGEFPTSAQPFATALEEGKPDLSGIRFAIFGLGDSGYDETFNFGGKRFEELMRARGAEMLGPRITHDASGSDMADDLALPWADEVVGLATASVSERA